MNETIRATQRKLTDDKFCEMIIYISDLSHDDSTFGMTKLNKLLFYSDFIHFAYHGTSISNQEYQKLPHGPAPRRVLPTLRELQENNEIVIREKSHHRFTQKRPIALRDANLEIFSANEVDIIHSVVDQFQALNAKQISDHSYSFIGWELAEEGDRIPYEVALLGRREPTFGEIEYAKSLRGVAQEALSKDRKDA